MWTELTGEQIGQEPMGFFERLKAAASAEWRVYTQHPFTNGMADGLLVKAAFRHYLVQDYLFLIEFARAYASTLRRRYSLRRRSWTNHPYSLGAKPNTGRT